ncbi:MAG: class I SAM-dependent methyltransferase [Verrucomicrobia bacterium]|nr:class I SAM-dependent methyltransferase [Verrucomicrobiota bacterium]
MPQPFVANAVVDAVRELPGFPNLDVLDLSCGEAEILDKLKVLGCRVQGTHYRDDDYIVQNRARFSGIPITTNVDLHKPLPFENARFDVVIMSEVIEHLEWHGNVIHEAGRILRPGGFLLCTSPNIFRLHSRFQFFFTGKHKLIRRRLGWDLRYDERYAYHISPVDFPMLHALLYQSGMRIRELRPTWVKPFKTFFFGLLYPFVWVGCRLTLDRNLEGPGLFLDGERDLNHWLCDPVLLFSEQLFVVARKQPA